MTGDGVDFKGVAVGVEVELDVGVGTMYTSGFLGCVKAAILTIIITNAGIAIKNINFLKRQT
jgi:hypothetical protein